MKFLLPFLLLFSLFSSLPHTSSPSSFSQRFKARKLQSKSTSTALFTPLQVFTLVMNTIKMSADKFTEYANGKIAAARENLQEAINNANKQSTANKDCIFFMNFRHLSVITYGSMEFQLNAFLDVYFEQQGNVAKQEKFKELLQNFMKFSNLLIEALELKVNNMCFDTDEREINFNNFVKQQERDLHQRIKAEQDVATKKIDEFSFESWKSFYGNIQNVYTKAENVYKKGNELIEKGEKAVEKLDNTLKKAEEAVDQVDEKFKEAHKTLINNAKKFKETDIKTAELLKIDQRAEQLKEKIKAYDKWHIPGSDIVIDYATKHVDEFVNFTKAYPLQKSDEKIMELKGVAISMIDTFLKQVSYVMDAEKWIYEHAKGAFEYVNGLKEGLKASVSEKVEAAKAKIKSIEESAEKNIDELTGGNLDNIKKVLNSDFAKDSSELILYIITLLDYNDKSQLPAKTVIIASIFKKIGKVMYSLYKIASQIFPGVGALLKPLEWLISPIKLGIEAVASVYTAVVSYFTMKREEGIGQSAAALINSYANFIKENRNFQKCKTIEEVWNTYDQQKTILNNMKTLLSPDSDEGIPSDKSRFLFRELHLNEFDTKSKKFDDILKAFITKICKADIHICLNIFEESMLRNTLEEISFDDMYKKKKSGTISMVQVVKDADEAKAWESMGFESVITLPKENLWVYICRECNQNMLLVNIALTNSADYNTIYSDYSTNVCKKGSTPTKMSVQHFYKNYYLCTCYILKNGIKGFNDPLVLIKTNLVRYFSLKIEKDTGKLETSEIRIMPELVEWRKSGFAYQIMKNDNSLYDKFISKEIRPTRFIITEGNSCELDDFLFARQYLHSLIVETKTINLVLEYENLKSDAQPVNFLQIGKKKGVRNKREINLKSSLLKECKDLISFPIDLDEPERIVDFNYILGFKEASNLYEQYRSYTNSWIQDDNLGLTYSILYKQNKKYNLGITKFDSNLSNGKLGNHEAKQALDLVLKNLESSELIKSSVSFLCERTIKSSGGEEYNSKEFLSQSSCYFSNEEFFNTLTNPKYKNYDRNNLEKAKFFDTTVTKVKENLYSSYLPNKKTYFDSSLEGKHNFIINILDQIFNKNDLNAFKGQDIMDKEFDYIFEMNFNPSCSKATSGYITWFNNNQFDEKNKASIDKKNLNKEFLLEICDHENEFRKDLSQTNKLVKIMKKFFIRVAGKYKENDLIGVLKSQEDYKALQGYITIPIMTKNYENKVTSIKYRVSIIAKPAFEEGFTGVFDDFFGWDNCKTPIIDLFGFNFEKLLAATEWDTQKNSFWETFKSAKDYPYLKEIYASYAKVHFKNIKPLSFYKNKIPAFLTHGHPEGIKLFADKCTWTSLWIPISFESTNAVGYCSRGLKKTTKNYNGVEYIDIEETCENKGPSMDSIYWVHLMLYSNKLGYGANINDILYHFNNYSFIEQMYEYGFYPEFFNPEGILRIPTSSQKAGEIYFRVFTRYDMRINLEKNDVCKYKLIN